MSVAGMGDVLAGVIGGLLIQGLTAGDAVKLGATVHSLAADELVAEQGERGLLATELLPVIRRLVNP
jgi:NAD(P)H-hydrate epimerase